MTTLFLVLFAVIQGITEVLPVSSSVHYLLLSALYHISPRQEFNVFLHMGSVLAFVTYFHKYVLTLLHGLGSLLRGKFHEHSCVMLLTLVICTLPAVIGGAVLHFYPIPTQSPVVLGITSMIFGILLYVMDRAMPYTHGKVMPNYKEALFLGCLQILAFFSGVSRLGICITGGRCVGLSTKTSIQWAFLMAMPTLGGACVLELPKILSCITTTPYFSLCLVFLVTFCCGISTLFVVHRFALIERFDFFALYRIALAILLFVVMGSWPS